jgi:hypothetical protein
MLNEKIKNKSIKKQIKKKKLVSFYSHKPGWKYKKESPGH